MSDQESHRAIEAPANTEERPTWRRPTFSVLDVEAGTVTVSGPVADGNGSTS
ncbi:MAG: hypothetical protein V4618_11075 [Pseudomonadota bacterium]